MCLSVCIRVLYEQAAPGHRALSAPDDDDEYVCVLCAEREHRSAHSGARWPDGDRATAPPVQCQSERAVTGLLLLHAYSSTLTHTPYTLHAQPCLSSTKYVDVDVDHTD